QESVAHDRYPSTRPNSEEFAQPLRGCAPRCELTDAPPWIAVGSGTSSLGHFMPITLEEHLFAPGPKRILALDGGGVKGIITIAFLEKIEQVLKVRSGRGNDFRLSDYFDLVGGTSVGSLLATLIALGYPVSEIKNLF